MNNVEAVVGLLDDWDIEAIKDHVKCNPKCVIKNRGADNSNPVYHMYGRNTLWGATISCRDDVYKQILELAS